MPNDSIQALTDRIANQIGSNTPEPVSTQTLDNVVVQDFVTYRYLLEPDNSRVLDLGALSKEGTAYLDDLENEGAAFESLEYLAGFLTALEAVVLHAFDHAIPTSSYSSFPQLKVVTNYRPRDTARKVIRRLYNVERFEILTLLEHYGKMRRFLWDYVYPTFLRDAKTIHRALGNAILANPDGHHSSEPTFSWAKTDFGLGDSVAGPSELDYPFELYPANSVNIGTAMVYRQRWLPLGIQPGEVVRTVPLAPGQSEKITTKITRRSKRTTSIESNSESETTTESSDTTKDSSEIINEASQSQKWNVEAEASYGGFGFGGSVSAGYENSQGSNSKETASNLSEVMKKTASKMKRQSKVSVVTETEIGFEEETASTIKNPNDEIAVTYYYHTLQQQYEVFTYLAEVRNVVFVAERVPSPLEINETWVRRHDWILRGALKDDSFAGILNELIQDVDEEDLLGGLQNNPYEDMVNKARDFFARFNTEGTGAGQGGLSVPDIYSEPQKQLDSYLRDKAQRTRANALREMRRQRLYDHLRQNVLHYCRAIWAAEDPEQRLMRYRKEGRTVPAKWQGTLISSGQLSDSITELAPNGMVVELTDVLDVTGPIGFSGNYVVFPLRQLDPDLINAEIEVDDSADPITVTLPLQEVLNQVLRAPYSKDGGLRDPALDLFIDQAEKMIRRLDGKEADDIETLTFETPDDDLVRDFLVYMPQFTSELLDGENVRRQPDGKLIVPIPLEDYGQFLHRKNATRRFLVDSNNLFVSIHVGDGTALEPFKQTHRYIDVLKAGEEHRAMQLKNERRDLLKSDPDAFDPDISKVVVHGAVPPAGLAGLVVDEQDD